VFLSDGEIRIVFGVWRGLKKKKRERDSAYIQAVAVGRAITTNSIYSLLNSIHLFFQIQTPLELAS
jgi:hypothetical protein